MITREQRRELARRRVRRERRVAAAAVGAVVVAAGALFALSQGDSQVAARSTTPRPPAPPQLPRGGRTLLPGLPRRRLLRRAAGSGARAARGSARRRMRSPADAPGAAVRSPGRPVMPALELIATSPRRARATDGRYSCRQPRAVIGRYLAAARRGEGAADAGHPAGPRRTSCSEVPRATRRWLEQPDVGLALDPEWSMAPGEVPGKVIGLDRRRARSTGRRRTWRRARAQAPPAAEAARRAPVHDGDGPPQRQLHSRPALPSSSTSTASAPDAQDRRSTTCSPARAPVPTASSSSTTRTST